MRDLDVVESAPRWADARISENLCCNLVSSSVIVRRHVPFQLASALEKGPAVQISKFRLAVAGVLTATSFGLLGAGMAYAVGEHMMNAENDLRQAASELQQAGGDAGGHRDQAFQLVNQAIDQVNQGIQFNNSHQ